MHDDVSGGEQLENTGLDGNGGPGGTNGNTGSPSKREGNTGSPSQREPKTTRPWPSPAN
jgi:hypothetical protein